MANIICTIIFGVLAIACFVIGFRQYSQKGILLNNAYIYSSQSERDTMDKKPYYRQSGIVFLLIGVMFLINALEFILTTGWLFYLVIGIVVVTVVYAIVSTLIIQKN